MTLAEANSKELAAKEQSLQKQIDEHMSNCEKFAKQKNDVEVALRACVLPIVLEHEALFRQDTRDTYLDTFVSAYASWS